MHLLEYKVILLLAVSFLVVVAMAVVVAVVMAVAMAVIVEVTKGATISKAHHPNYRHPVIAFSFLIKILIFA